MSECENRTLELTFSEDPDDQGIFEEDDSIPCIEAFDIDVEGKIHHN